MRGRLLFVWLCTGCSPTPPSGVFKCSTDDDCPAEQRCARDAPDTTSRHCYLEPPDVTFPELDAATECASRDDRSGCRDAQAPVLDARAQSPDDSATSESDAALEIGDGSVYTLPDGGSANDGGADAGADAGDAGGTSTDCTEQLTLPGLGPIAAYRCTLDDGGTGLIPCPTSGLPNLGCIDPSL